MPDFKSAEEFLSHIKSNTPYSGCLLSNLYTLGSDLGGESTGILLGKCFILGCWEKGLAPVFVMDGCTVDGELLWGIRKAVYPYILRLPASSPAQAVYFVNSDDKVRALVEPVLQGICTVWFVRTKTKKPAVYRRRPSLSVSRLD